MDGPPHESADENASIRKEEENKDSSEKERRDGDDDKRREADITHRPRTSPGTSSRRPFFFPPLFCDGEFAFEKSSNSRANSQA